MVDYVSMGFHDKHRGEGSLATVATATGGFYEGATDLPGSGSARWGSDSQRYQSQGEVARLP